MVILASKSPRRKELLKTIINDFIIVPPQIDEYLYPFEKLSLAKAKQIALDYQDALIISADTIVIKDEKVFGKPKDKDEAYSMLRELSSSMHEVKTIYTILYPSKNIEITRIVSSKVFFNDLSDELIEAYIKTSSPFDKAGGYGIQDKDFPLVNKIEGSYSNIVGLPIEELKKDLTKIGLIA